MSKQKLDKVLTELRRSTGLSQWRNDLAVVNWFNSLERKENLKFIELDIVQFYPSITKELFTLALNWAASFVDIPEEDRELYLHTKQSLLVNDGCTWVKKGPVNFDIAMGAYDGAEACDLVALFLLSKLQHLPINVGAYRDDVLAVCSLTPSQVEKVKQKMVLVFQEHGLRVTAVANTKVANFLDVTLDLTNKVHRPYSKPGTHLEYVHTDSNHPQHVTKHAVSEISRRLSLLSSNEEIFNNAKVPYEEAIKRAGHTEKLSYQPRVQQGQSRRRRRRKILWFNPPFDASMTTKLGKVFLNILDKCFLVGHVLRRILD